jgi:hypothetical protein
VRIPRYDGDADFELIENGDVGNVAPKTEGIMWEYLLTILAKLRKKGDIYTNLQRGFNWIYPPAPSSTIKSFCLKRVFLFDPLISEPSVGHLTCPHCNGKNTGPKEWPHAKAASVARRVVSNNDCYYIIGRRYRCHTCKHTRELVRTSQEYLDLNEEAQKQVQQLWAPSSFMAYDQRVLDSLPNLPRLEFPAVLSHRGGLDKAIITELNACVSSRSNFEGFADRLEEHHCLRHAILQEQYYTEQLHRCVYL